MSPKNWVSSSQMFLIGTNVGRRKDFWQNSNPFLWCSSPPYDKMLRRQPQNENEGFAGWQAGLKVSWQFGK